MCFVIHDCFDMCVSNDGGTIQLLVPAFGPVPFACIVMLCCCMLEWLCATQQLIVLTCVYECNISCPKPVGLKFKNDNWKERKKPKTEDKALNDF